MIIGLFDVTCNLPSFEQVYDLYVCRHYIRYGRIYERFFSSRCVCCWHSEKRRRRQLRDGLLFILCSLGAEWAREHILLSLSGEWNALARTCECACVRIRSGFSYSTNYTAIWANVLRCSRVTVISWLFYIQLRRRRRRRFHREKPISSVANHENYAGFVYTGCRYCMTNCVFVPPRCAFFCLTYSTFALRSCYARACGVICKINHMPMLSQFGAVCCGEICANYEFKNREGPRCTLSFVFTSPLLRVFFFFSSSDSFLHIMYIFSRKLFAYKIFALLMDIFLSFYCCSFLRQFFAPQKKYSICKRKICFNVVSREKILHKTLLLTY